MILSLIFTGRKVNSRAASCSFSGKSNTMAMKGGGCMDQIKIGKFIAELRKEKKLTQEELAVLLGVSNKSVSRWENGVSQTKGY